MHRHSTSKATMGEESCQPMNELKVDDEWNVPTHIEQKKTNMLAWQKDHQILQLKAKLQEKEAAISQFQRKEQQISEEMHLQKQQEIDRMAAQWTSREKQLQQQLNSLAEAQKTKQSLFQSVVKTMENTSAQAHSFQKQVTESTEITKLKSDLSLKQQKNKQLAESLRRNLEQLQTSNQQRQRLKKQMFSNLASLKLQNQKKEGERLATIDTIKSHYKQLEQSLGAESKALKESYERQVAGLKEENQNQVSKIKKLLQKRIQNESGLQQEIEKLKQEKFKFETNEKQYLRQKEPLEKNLKISTQKLGQANRKLNQAQKLLTQDKKKFQSQLIQIKQAYQKKASQLSSNCKQLLEKQKQATQKYKQSLQNEVYQKLQLQAQRKQLLQAKNAIQQKLKRDTSQASRTIELLKAKGSKAQSELSRLTAIIQQVRNVINSSFSSLRNITDEQLAAKLKQGIETIKIGEATAKTAYSEAFTSLNLVLQMGQKNKRFLKLLEDGLKRKQSIDSLKTFEERTNDANHLGFLINSVVNNIKALISARDQVIKQKQQSVNTLKGEIISCKKELQVKQSLLENHRQKQSALQLQNRALIIAAESDRTEKQKIKQQYNSLQGKVSTRKYEVQQLAANLQVAEKSWNQEKCNSELLQARLLKQQAESSLELSLLKEELKKIKKLLEESDDNLKMLKQSTKQGSQKVNQLNEKIRTMEERGKLSAAELEKQKRQMIEKEKRIKEQIECQKAESMNRIGKTIKQMFGSQLERPDAEGLIAFLQKNGASSSSAFSVSHILQKMPKERSFLLEECCKFFGANGLVTKLSYKYDEFCKNFGHYLPTLQNKFLFAVILKTKKNVVFGVIASSVGRDSRAFAFNLSTMKIMHKFAKSRVSTASSFESSMLKFGNDEIIIKNNVSLEIKINTMIIGERYFEFSKEDLLGRDETDSLALEAMEIHRLVTV